MKIDPVLISAYLDGEVPEPFAAQVAEALEHDPEAKVLLEQLVALRGRYPRVSDAHIAERAERGWTSIRTRLSVEPVRPWHRRVALPIPALAGIAAMLLALVGVVIWSLVPRAAEPAEYLANAQGVDVTIRVDGNDMEAVLQWLVDKNMLGEVNIQLPEQRFEVLGEPVFLKPELIPEGIRE
jgi:anti-sigma factor RsiW